MPIHSHPLPFPLRDWHSAALLMAVGLSLSSCASRGRPVQPEVTPVAPTHEVIPAPVSAHLLPNDRFVLTPDTTIAVPAGNDRVARLG